MSSNQEQLIPNQEQLIPGRIVSTPSQSGGSPATRPVRKRQRVNGEKFCQVCGDKALAHHFGALACETCKAFFRRNANAREQKVCLFKGACTVDIKTRRFCPACRLKKCFDVGMRPDLILDDDEKTRRRMHQHNSKKLKAEPLTAGETAVMISESLSSTSFSPFSHSSKIQSPPCTVTTTYSPEPVSATASSSLEQEQNNSVLEQAWQSASELTAAEISASKSLASFSAHGSVYSHGASDPHTDLSFTSEARSSYGVLRVTSEGCDSKTALVLAHDLSQSPTFSALQSQASVTPSAPVAEEPSHHAGADSELPSDSHTLLTSHDSTSQPVYSFFDSSGYQTPSDPPLCRPLQAGTPQHYVSSRPATNPGTHHSLQLSDLAQSYGIRPFEHVPRELLPSDPYMYWRLSEEERCLLTQLSAAYQDTILSILKGSPPREFIPSHLITPENYLQEGEREARNAVTFAKRMEDFRQLRQEDQIGLLKASTSQVLGVRSCALYVAERDAWLTSQGYYTPDHCRILLPSYPLIEPALDYCRVVKSIVKNDVTLYALLHCLVLFDPCDDRIMDRQLINGIRDKYVILLRHYLQSVYSYAHSEKYLLALQENLMAYRTMNRDGKPYLRIFFPTISSKLLLEILDLD